MYELRYIWPPIFVDYFRYLGTLGLPGSDSIPEQWTISSGSYTTSDEKQLTVTSPGSLLYSSTTLGDLTTGGPNYAWVIQFFGQENLRFSLHGRRSSTGQSLSVDVDFENSQLKLLKNDGVTTTLAERGYEWRTDVDDFYSIELWTYGTQIETRVNGAIVFQVENDFNQNEEGFAIETFSTGTYHFAKMAVHIVEAWPEPNIAIEDGSDLLLLYRKLMKEQIENPDTHDWETFVRARKYWQLKKDYGLSNQEWSSLGYPIREPLPEEWLNS